MNQIISTQEIQETKTYQSLERMYQSLLLNYNTKKQITHGLLVWKNTGVIVGSLGGNPLRVVKELIESQKS
jgi:hypothetical protein